MTQTTTATSDLVIDATDPAMIRAQEVAMWLEFRFCERNGWWPEGEIRRLANRDAIELDDWWNSPPVRRLGIRVVKRKPAWDLMPDWWWTTEPATPKQEIDV